MIEIGAGVDAGGGTEEERGRAGRSTSTLEASVLGGAKVSALPAVFGIGLEVAANPGARGFSGRAGEETASGLADLGGGTGKAAATAVFGVGGEIETGRTAQGLRWRTGRGLGGDLIGDLDGKGVDPSIGIALSTGLAAQAEPEDEITEVLERPRRALGGDIAVDPTQGGLGKGKAFAFTFEEQDQVVRAAIVLNLGESSDPDRKDLVRFRGGAKVEGFGRNDLTWIDIGACGKTSVGRAGSSGGVAPIARSGGLACVLLKGVTPRILGRTKVGRIGLCSAFDKAELGSVSRVRLVIVGSVEGEFDDLARRPREGAKDVPACR